MSKPLFSCVIISRNEEKHLPVMFKSLEDFKQRGGETIIVDTGSSDKTAEVARAWGAKVFEVGDRFRITINKELADKINNNFLVENEPNLIEENTNLFDFSGARNYAASLASNDLIMMPDSDECWTNLNIDAINEHIKNGVQQFEYLFTFAFDQHGKPTIQFVHSKFYDRRALRWSGCIHEILRGEAKRQYLEKDIAYLCHHQNPTTDRSGYLRGLAYDCFLNPESDRNCHYLSREMMYTNRFHSAIEEFKRHIAMDKWDAERSQSTLYIGDCYMYLGDIEEALIWWHKSFAICPRREPFLRLGEHYFKKNDWQRTVAYVTAALEIPSVNFYSNNMEDYTHKPHEFLYTALWWLGQHEKSKEHFDKAFAFAPENPKFIHDRRFYYPVEKGPIS